jgi:two-component system, LuxR family, response regulator DctR
MQAEGAQAAERDARLASLTEREREVMTRVAAGKLNKVIADELNVSVRTVEVHRARVFAKLGVRSAAEVATLLAGR